MFACILGDGDRRVQECFDLWKFAELVDNAQFIDLVEDEAFWRLI